MVGNKSMFDILLIHRNKPRNYNRPLLTMLTLLPTIEKSLVTDKTAPVEHPYKGCVGIVFINGIWMGGEALRGG